MKDGENQRTKQTSKGDAEDRAQRRDKDRLDTKKRRYINATKKQKLEIEVSSVTQRFSKTEHKYFIIRQNESQINLAQRPGMVTRAWKQEKKQFNKQMTFLKQAYDIYYILFSAKIHSACLDVDLFWEFCCILSCKIKT